MAVRKSRKFLTLESYNMIIRLSTDPSNTLKMISTLTDYSISTIRNALKQHSLSNSFVQANEKLRNKINLKNSSFDSNEMTIFNAVSCNNILTQNEIKQILGSSNLVELSQPTICRKLKKLKLTRKRLSLIPNERNSLEKIDARSIYASDISRIPIDNLIFLDESGFNNHLTRSYGYSMLNTSAYVNVPANKGVNRSLMCAISSTGIVSYECKVGAYNTALFISFIEIHLVPFFRSNPNKILIMDNCRFHHSREVANVLTSNNIVFKFLPAYSPQLNPIEEFFSMIKSKFSANKILNPAISVENNIALTLSSIFATECSGFYRNMIRWLEKARTREPFI